MKMRPPSAAFAVVAVMLTSNISLGQQSVRGHALASIATKADTTRIVVFEGRGPTAYQRARAANALRRQLAHDIARTGAHALVISTAETCAKMTYGDTICDLAVPFDMMSLVAYELRTTLAMWVNVDSTQKGHRVMLNVGVLSRFPDSDIWSERFSNRFDGGPRAIATRSSRALRIVLRELPVISRCQDTEDSTALRGMLSDVRGLLVERPGSTLARICLASILIATASAPDSILALSEAVLSRDPDNTAALFIQTLALDDKMMMDSANILKRRIARTTQEIVGSSAGAIHFELTEGRGWKGSKPRMWLSYRTTREYGCALPLTGEYRAHADTIILGPFRMPGGPVDCEETVEPAIGNRVVALKIGNYQLQLVHAGSTDLYTVQVTDSTILTRPVGVPKLSVISLSPQRRVPRDSSLRH